MKYWRGYLVAAVLGLITWGLIQLADRFSDLVDMVYPYLSRTVQGFLTTWTGSVDFLVWQVFAVLLVVILLATVVLMIVFRWNFFQWLGWVLACAMLICFLHTGLYGLNYQAGPLAQDVRLQVTEYTLDELEDATKYYRNLANDLAEQLPRNADGDVIFSSFEELAEQAGEGFECLTYDHSMSVFAGSTLPVKKLGWADMYTSMGITGVTMGLTGEAAVNPQTPAVGQPFTMCHEMAHRICIATERDANFAAFLASSVNSSAEFQYSAYFMAYRYCYSALASVNDPQAAAAAARLDIGVNDYLRHDLTQYSRFFAENQDEKATRFADTVNDTYIKINGDEMGIESYGEVCDLLVSWYVQEIDMPSQKDEASEKFDPYDENQVDLSDIVGLLPDLKPEAGQ